MKKDELVVFDTTLRDGEQSPGVSLDPQNKVRIAQKLEVMGIDVIEAGFPAASRGDAEAVKAVAETCKKATVAALARASHDDIDKAWAAIQGAKNPRIHTFIATSGIHMKHKLNMEPEKVLTAAVEAVKYARSLCADVQFSAEDGSRSDPDFLCRVFEAVIEAGATTVNLPDTVGYAETEEFGNLVKYVLANTPSIDQAIFSVHCHNDLGCATANTLAAIKAGARQAELTINGIGERAGNTSLEEVVMMINTRQTLFPVITNIITENIMPMSNLVRMLTGMTVQPNKAIVGANAFAHEAGIHQDGVLKNPMCYEIMRPETVGLSGNNLPLGKHSGRKALADKLFKMGYALSKEEINSLFANFKELAEKKKHVVEEDLEALVSSMMQVIPSTWILTGVHVSAGTEVDPYATIKLKNNAGEDMRDSGPGNGPIDAAFNTITKMTGTKAQMLRFAIGALSGGTDAQGSVTVRLQDNGYTVIGRGTDPDIITASAKAYINGLNRIEYLRKNPPEINPKDRP